MHVKLIELGATYRPQLQLKGIEGARDTYLFVGANAGLTDRETTARRGRNGSFPDVIEKDWALAMGTYEGEVEGAELTVKRARAYVPCSPTWTRDGVAGEDSRNEGGGAKGEGEGGQEAEEECPPHGSWCREGGGG